MYSVETADEVWGSREIALDARVFEPYAHLHCPGLFRVTDVCQRSLCLQRRHNWTLCYDEGGLLLIVMNDLADERGAGTGLHTSEVEVVATVDGATAVGRAPSQLPLPQHVTLLPGGTESQVVTNFSAHLGGLVVEGNPRPPLRSVSTPGLAGDLLHEVEVVLRLGVVRVTAHVRPGDDLQERHVHAADVVAPFVDTLDGALEVGVGKRPDVLTERFVERDGDHHTVGGLDAWTGVPEGPVAGQRVLDRGDEVDVDAVALERLGHHPATLSLADRFGDQSLDVRHDAVEHRGLSDQHFEQLAESHGLVRRLVYRRLRNLVAEHRAGAVEQCRGDLTDAEPAERERAGELVLLSHVSFDAVGELQRVERHDLVDRHIADGATDDRLLLLADNREAEEGEQVVDLGLILRGFVHVNVLPFGASSLESVSNESKASLLMRIIRKKLSILYNYIVHNSKNLTCCGDLVMAVVLVSSVTSV